MLMRMIANISMVIIKLLSKNRVILPETYLDSVRILTQGIS